MIIAFIIIQILIDLYFLWFIVLANTAIDTIVDHVPTLATMKLMAKIKDNISNKKNK